MSTELPRPLNREQLSQVFKDHQSLVAFERMFQTVSITFPAMFSAMTTAVEAAALGGDTAGEKSNLALALLAQIAASLDIIASGPVAPPAAVDPSDMQMMLTAPRYTMDPKLASTRALSVLGDATAIPGEALPIVATADGQVLLRNGTLAFTAPTAPTAGLTISTALVFALANDLAALEGLGTTGMPARTAADTWAIRTHTGSASITIGNGGGVAGDPTYSVNTTWVGQTAITTLGTITTGTWTGTAIAAINGGTGQTVYTVGDILYASTTTALSKLAVGTSTQVLHGGTTPAYSAIVAGDLPALGGAPTVKVGTAVVTGTANTYISTDSAPQIDQAMVPTWTGLHTFSNTAGGGNRGLTISSAQARMELNETDQGADGKNWWITASGGNFFIGAANDAHSASENAYTIIRGAGAAVASHTFAVATVTKLLVDSTGISTGVWNATAIGETKGGTAQTTYTLGDLLYSSAANTLTKLAGNITTTRKFLNQTGGGAVSAAPLWSALVAADIPALTTAISKTATNVFTGVGGYRTADTTANSATLAADTDLTLTVNETGHYRINIELSFYEATLGSGGFQFDLNSGTATIGSFFLDVIGFGTALFGNAGITSVATATGIATVVTSSTAPSWIKATGYVNISGTGTIAIRWAQNTLLAIDPTTLKKGSSFTLTKLA